MSSISVVRSKTLAVGALVALAAFLVYWLSNRLFDAGRGDLFYLADAFLHGRTSIDVILGPNDIIRFNGQAYVPFAPFPAILFMPLVAITGPVTADQLEPGINAALAAFVVFLAWWVPGRMGVTRWRIALRWPSCSASRPRSGGSPRAVACGTRGTWWP